jgi:hypothetical protein
LSRSAFIVGIQKASTIAMVFFFRLVVPEISGVFFGRLYALWNCAGPYEAAVGLAVTTGCPLASVTTSA